MKFLITGSVGFIGSALSKKLLEKGNYVSGVDNHNNYYDPDLKNSRLKFLLSFSNYSHNKFDISSLNNLEKIFKSFKPDIVINLAAQAGVRYSIENPLLYISSNITGFANILECCKKYNVKHLIYASTSSVYGANSNLPFSEKDECDRPLSVYAASKKSNELMAHSYSYIHNLPTTGLRFFTVYGPWGRPDMALFKFTRSILNNEKIDVYNNGNHSRDFTYIDDIVNGICLAIDNIPTSNQICNSNKHDYSRSCAPWQIFNIGNNKPVKLLKYIEVIEKVLKKKAIINFLPLQMGDVPDTSANIDSLKKLGYKPSTSVEEGIAKFIDWYLSYYDQKIK